jgi:phytoene dehydrogenase-like protein
LNEIYSRDDVRDFFTSYIRKQIGMSPERLLAMDYASRIPESVRRPVRIRYPLRGGTTLVEALVREARRRGVRLHPATTVESVRWSGNAVRLQARSKGSVMEYLVDAVIAAVPLPVVQDMVGLRPDRNLFRSTTVFSYGLSSSLDFPFAWVNDTRSATKTLRMYSPTAWSSKVAPRGHSSVQVQVNGPAGLGAERDAFSLLRRFDVRSSQIVVRIARTERYAYPVLTQRNVRRAEQAERTIRQRVPRLWLAGRGKMRYWNMEEVAADALEVAADVLRSVVSAADYVA